MAATPQQNDTVERRNRTFFETAGCLTANQDLPQRLWAEAISTTTYFHNCLPSKVTHILPLKNYVSNTGPDASHLRVFGSTAFVHIPSNKRDKLSPKTTKCILVGYDIPSKTYRCFESITHKIYLSRDVEFIEHRYSPPTSSPEPNPQTPPSLEQLFPSTHLFLSVRVPVPTYSLTPLSSTPYLSSPSSPTHTPPPSPPPSLTPSPFPPVDNNPPVQPPLCRSSRQPLFPRHLYDFVEARVPNHNSLRTNYLSGSSSPPPMAPRHAGNIMIPTKLQYLSTYRTPSRHSYCLL